MKAAYVPVQWNTQKRIYDLALWLGILVYLVGFIGLSSFLFTGEEALSLEIVLIRALATCAFLMLTLILCIGPLARLNSVFLPLLYNRRHFGVSMCVVALAHSALATVWYHGFGVESPIASLFASVEIVRWIDIPFQPFGAAALLIIVLLASTSHDFWNANLGAPLWKALHMAVYLAYVLLVAHVALGALQEPNTGFTFPMLLLSVFMVTSLHMVAAIKGFSLDSGLATADWVEVGKWQDIQNNQAKIISIAADERIAVFRYEQNKLAAVSNACEHQNGPLGEGRVIDGCITCPWHGFQYRPEDGCSPPPFSEKIATYELKLKGEHIFINPKALPKGTPRAIVHIPSVIPVEEQGNERK